MKMNKGTTHFAFYQKLLTTYVFLCFFLQGSV
jgi:hypothetical protein